MDDFKTIYRILKALDAGMDCDAPDPEAYSAEALGVSKSRRDNLVAMMQQEGYVSGVHVREYYDGTR